MERKRDGLVSVREVVRATISFPSEFHEILEGIAKENKVSLSWVAREVAEEYIADRWLLFGKQA